MIGSDELISRAEEFAIAEFTRGLTEKHIYHNQQHTRDVVQAARCIADAIKLSDDEKEMVTLAAWFHDLGYIQGWKDHEERSAEQAKSFLQKFNYPQDRIEKIIGCILATRVPQQPKSLLEKVICDADLLNLGEEGSIEKGEQLRREQEALKGIMISDVEWLKHTLDFFVNHRFHTEFVRRRFDEWKQKNIAVLQKKLEASLMKETMGKHI